MMADVKAIKNQIRQGYSNVLKCSSGQSESQSHKMMKFFICDFLWVKNVDFMTEVTFKTGGRADILIPEWGLAIEILHSEKIETYLKKHYSVPSIPVDTTMNKADVYNLLVELYNTQGAVKNEVRQKLMGGLDSKNCVSAKISHSTLGHPSYSQGGAK